MKLYYNQHRQRYELSHLGKLIDHDHALTPLMMRNEWATDDDLPPTEFSGDDQLSDEEIAAFFAGEVA